MLIYTQPEGNKESEDENMNEIYIAIRITEYGTGKTTCTISQSVGEEPLETHELELAHALKLMWELVLAGGKREVSINRLDRDIVTMSAYIFLPG